MFFRFGLGLLGVFAEGVMSWLFIFASRESKSVRPRSPNAEVKMGMDCPSDRKKLCGSGGREERKLWR